MKHLSIFLFSGVAVFALLLVIFSFAGYEGRTGTWESRIESFISGEGGSSYQVTQSKIAIAGGGMFGKGPGNSTQRNFLPNPFSDFIYAIIIEEYGLMGGGFVMLLYLFLLYRCILIVVKSPQAFGALLAVGLSFSLVVQALVNMAVAVNLLPVTGLVLPFLSMGGTSFIFTSVAIGIILSVSRYIEESEEVQSENEVKPVEG